jgi:tellurite resistance protein
MDSDEVGVLLEAMLGHEVLAQSFSESVIQQTVDKMVKKASPNAAGKIGMVGKIALEREVKEVKGKSSSEDIELMLAILVDIASADNDGIEPAERTVINKISNSLGYGNFI